MWFFSSFLQCVGVAYLVFRFLSEESFSYVPIDLLCLWENVSSGSSHVAILNWNIHASLSLDSVGGIAYGHQLKSSIIVIFSPSHFVQMKDILQICYRSIPHLLPVGGNHVLSRSPKESILRAHAWQVEAW